MSIWSSPNKTGWVHWRVKKVAIEMAEAMYEALASKGDSAANVWYQQNKDRKRYVATTWPNLIVQARTTLTKMLTLDYPKEMKDEIAQALIDDNALRAGRNRGERRVQQSMLRRMTGNGRSN